MYMRFGVLIFIMTLSCGLLQAQQNPLVGTWKTNTAKSKVYLGGAATVQVAKYEASGTNGIKYTSDRVAADGTKSHVEFTAYFDGSAAPNRGAPTRHRTPLERIAAS